MHEKILVIEDEVELADALTGFLIREGYRAEAIHDGDSALEVAQATEPDLILLDMVLPGIGGLQVCKMLKDDPQTSGIPVIMISARHEECDVVLGLSVGAEDYIAKPYRLREIQARIENVFRRGSARSGDRRDVSPAEDSPPIEVADIVIEPNRYEVRIGEDAVELTSTEMQLLYLLAKNPGRVFTREQLLGTAPHGGSRSVGERNVDVHVRCIRRKMGKHRNLIQTVRGAGYRFQASAG